MLCVKLSWLMEGDGGEYMQRPQVWRMRHVCRLDVVIIILVFNSMAPTALVMIYLAMLVYGFACVCAPLELRVFPQGVDTSGYWLQSRITLRWGRHMHDMSVMLMGNDPRAVNVGCPHQNENRWRILKLYCKANPKGPVSQLALECRLTSSLTRFMVNNRPISSNKSHKGRVAQWQSV